VIQVRKAADRGRTTTDWLDSAHSFAFGSYRAPRFPGFRDLRVLNEDRVAPGAGFGAHPHADMEILTFVLAGALAHRDSSGQAGVLRPGDVQRMGAGTGIVHSETNASATEPVHFLQVWILPATPGLAPSYEQRSLGEPSSGRLLRVASPDAGDAALRVHQDVRVLRGRLEAGERVTHVLGAGRHAWIQALRGRVDVGGAELAAGDGAAVSGVSELSAVALDERTPSDVLVFDLR